jgi:transporter family protein
MNKRITAGKVTKYLAVGILFLLFIVPFYLMVINSFKTTQEFVSNPFALPSKTWLFLGLSGLATGASWVCYFRALQIGKASNVAPVDKLSVVLVAIFACVFLGERPVAREWAGIALVAAGVVTLAIKR